MIFNKEFDKSLWLILKGDKDKEKVVLDLISSIPAPLYQQMLDAFHKYREVMELEDSYILDREDINGEFLVNNIKYYFTLDMVLCCLTIGKKVKVYDKCYKIFEINLFSNTSYNKVENLSDQYLGSIYQPYLDITTNYEYINTFLGMMVVTRRTNYLPMYRKINVRMIPDDITINQFSENKRLLKIKKI